MSWLLPELVDPFLEEGYRHRVRCMERKKGSVSRPSYKWEGKNHIQGKKVLGTGIILFEEPQLRQGEKKSQNAAVMGHTTGRYNDDWPGDCGRY